MAGNLYSGTWNLSNVLVKEECEVAKVAMLDRKVSISILKIKHCNAESENINSRA